MSTRSGRTETGPDDDLLDWRVRAETRLTADLPAAYPGGPEHKAGARVVLTTVAARRGSVPLGFATPSSAALALSAAIRAASEAEALRATLRYKPTVSPWGASEAVTDETVRSLYDFFERTFVAVVFAYQSIEAIANEEIQRLVTAPQRVIVRGRWEDLDADGCERWLPTEQKLAEVLPGLLNITPPKKEPWWPAFKELGRMRHATIHIKADHAYPRTGEPADSYFSHLLGVKSMKAFPRTAVSVAEYLHHGRERPAWLRAARELAGQVPARGVTARRPGVG